MPCASGSTQSAWPPADSPAVDVVNALVEQNVEIPAGQLGQPPSDQKQAFQVPVRVVGRLTDPAEFDKIIVKNNANGLVLLKDVGHSVVGAEDYSSSLEYMGRNANGVGVEQLSNANALEVDAAAKAALKELSKSFPPGLEYAIAFDATTVVGDSIREVLVTLAEAIVIVIVVIFLFLLDWRATIIPRRHHSGFAHRHICFHQGIRLLHQLAHLVRHHAGHRAGGGRCHCCHRKRSAPHCHGALRSP